jgi:hypothetical protein
MPDISNSREARLEKLRLADDEFRRMALPALDRTRTRFAVLSKARTSRGHFSLEKIVRLLKPTYQAVRRWRSTGDIGRITRILREDNPTIDFRSTDYLILLRASLPDVDVKQCSKWAAALDTADYHRVRLSRLEEFWRDLGGIEGAARERARLWATVEDGEWARRSSLRRKNPEPPFHLSRGPIGSAVSRRMRRWIRRLPPR